MELRRFQTLLLVFISTQNDKGSSVVPSSTQVTAQLQCVPGWSQWINTDTPATGDGDKEGWTAAQKTAFFQGGGKIIAIECKTTTDIAYYSTGEINLCTIEDGSVCLNDDNFPVPCSDYMIRYNCSCEGKEITTLGSFTKEPAPSSAKPSVTAAVTSSITSSVSKSVTSHVTSKHQTTRHSQGTNRPHNGAQALQRQTFALFCMILSFTGIFKNVSV